jgi:hypothetical protein
MFFPSKVFFQKVFYLLSLAFYAWSCTSFFLKAEPDVREYSLKVSVVGDIMVHNTQLKSAYNSKCKCYDFKPSFEKVKKYLSATDILIGNLETTLPDNEKLYDGYPQFGTPNALAEALKDAGFHILTTSNNHSCDTGKIGLSNTIRVLDSLGIGRLGTYLSKEDHEKNRIHIIDKNGIKIAMLSYTYGTNGIAVPKGYIVNLIDKETIKKDLQLAKETNPDLVAVYYHFGNEYERFPDKSQKTLIDFSIEHGADIILGGHPHVLQPYEVRNVEVAGVKKRVLYIYSLGNFISSQYRRYTDGGIIFNFTIKKKTISLPDHKDKFIDFESVNYIPVWVHRNYVKDKLTYIVLPVEDYLENNKDIVLKEYEQKKMKLFYEDTIEHLEKYSVIEKADEAHGNIYRRL